MMEDPGINAGPIVDRHRGPPLQKDGRGSRSLYPEPPPSPPRSTRATGALLVTRHERFQSMGNSDQATLRQLPRLAIRPAHHAGRRGVADDCFLLRIPGDLPPTANGDVAQV